MIIFPAYAGLNLKVAIPAVVTFNIPRIRGVEPLGSQFNNRNWKIFPAYAGLNLGLFYISFSKLDIPRIRGVEPLGKTTVDELGAYSPHTRG